MTLDAGSSVGCATIRKVSNDLIEGPEAFNVEITTDDAFAVISNDLALVTITGELGEEEKREWEMEEKNREKRNKQITVLCFPASFSMDLLAEVLSYFSSHKV